MFCTLLFGVAVVAVGAGVDGACRLQTRFSLRVTRMSWIQRIYHKSSDRSAQHYVPLGGDVCSICLEPLCTCAFEMKEYYRD